MGFFKSLPKVFVRSAVRQVGRDGGKVISNKVYKGKHGTPLYNSGGPSGMSNSGSISERIEIPAINDQIDITKIDMHIQPQIKEGDVEVLMKGCLISFIPFGLLAVLYKGFQYLLKKNEYIYMSVPNRVSDNRHKIGYRLDGYSFIKTNQKRLLSDSEIERLRSRSKYYFGSIALYFSILAGFYFVGVYLGWDFSN